MKKIFFIVLIFVTFSANAQFTMKKIIYFKNNEHRLHTESQVLIDSICKKIGIDPEARIEITGYTDNVSSDRYNLKLSLKRADAVKEYFLKKNINEEIITVKGLGKENPAVPNDTEHNKSKNRRVEILVYLSADPDIPAKPGALVDSASKKKK